MVGNPARSGSSEPKLAVLLVAFALGAGGCQAFSQDRPEPPVSPITIPITTHSTTIPTTTIVASEVIAEVVSVTDGDTIRVIMPDGTNEPVRLIGIDAPEDGTALAQEATDLLVDLVLGKDVRMVVDVSDRDRFNRLLRYIYVGDLFVNEEMVRAGLAVAKRYRPDIAMALVLEAAQSGAEEAALGLYSSGSNSATTSNSGSCHSSYPDYCIPPPPPDLDCTDVGAAGFTVLSPDPHGFDANNDGVGCG